MVLLLANENFPVPSVMALRAAGYDVLAIGERHPGVHDQDVLALARAQSRWLLTFDTDYAELVFRRGLPAPPAVILVREVHYRPAEPAEWISKLIVSAAEVEGNFCVVTRDRMRKRPLLMVVPPAST